MTDKNGIAPYLLTPDDLKYKAPKKVITMKFLEKQEKKLDKAVNHYRFNPFKEYFNYLVQVILA